MNLPRFFIPHYKMSVVSRTETVKSKYSVIMFLYRLNDRRFKIFDSKSAKYVGFFVSGKENLKIPLLTKLCLHSSECLMLSLIGSKMSRKSLNTKILMYICCKKNFTHSVLSTFENKFLSHFRQNLTISAEIYRHF